MDDIFPYAGYVWNYGAFPQTWEDPTHKNPETGAFGDNDPLDVCEIGSANGFRGQIKQVKVLGVIALIDEGETDWKVLVIDVTDPLAATLNDIDDVQRLMPGYTFAVYEWLRTYKMPTGKPANEFAFHGEAKNKAYALQVIEENHHFWRRLVMGEVPNKTERYNIATANVTVDGSPYKVEAPADFFNALPEGVTDTAPRPTPAVSAGVQGFVENLQRAVRRAQSQSLYLNLSRLTSPTTGLVWVFSIRMAMELLLLPWVTLLAPSWLLVVCNPSLALSLSRSLSLSL